MLCHDPDAPLVSPGGTYGFVHWVLYNIPASVAQLPEGVQGYTSGQNDFGKRVYGGPMPPEGHGVHHYFFWLLALYRGLCAVIAEHAPDAAAVEEAGVELGRLERIAGYYASPGISAASITVSLDSSSTSLSRSAICHFLLGLNFLVVDEAYAASP